MPLRLSYAHSSASGPRAENQDATRLVSPAASLAASKGYLFALADGVSQCADGGLTGGPVPGTPGVAAVVAAVARTRPCMQGGIH